MDTASAPSFDFSVLVTLFCSRSLSRGASLSVSLRFLLTGILPKSCSSATSVLNEFFKMSQNLVDHRMPLHYVGDYDRSMIEHVRNFP